MPFDGTDYKKSSQLVLDLMAARDYLDEYGWCKGQLTNGPQRCLVGAVRQVVLGGAKKHLVTRNYQLTDKGMRCQEAEQVMSNYLNKHMYPPSLFPHRIGNPIEVARWNDRQLDYAQVRDFLNRVIDHELTKRSASTSNKE